MRISRLSLLTLVTYASLAWADPAPYLYVDLHMKGHGMFSVFCYVAGALHDYDAHESAGIEVDFSRRDSITMPIMALIGGNIIVNQFVLAMSMMDT